MFRAVVFLGLVAASAAQFPFGATGSQGADPSSSGPLTPTASLGGGLLGNVPNPASSSTNNANNPMGQIFQNPMMTYGLMGGDNLRRAIMLPLLSRMGGSNTAQYYYLRGGMDKYFKVMMTDMLSNMMAKNMGLSPMLAPMLVGQMMDAPDNYALTNMLFNRGGASGASGSSGSQQGGMFSPGFNPLAFASMSMM
ncbi:uncharacterized protein LOC143278614 [Babylonia areolata]|uniref:uncharacterized protein LOC143278614 n=1 Tax=Babylonia areolata TaxID=304850 RepID=UPI003FD09B3A